VNVTDFSSSALIEGLAIEAVSAIEIVSGKGQTTTRLNRNGDLFVVANKDNYPADVAKINTLINNCLDIRTHEKITNNPENHEDLGVTKETARYTVMFLDINDKEIVGMAVSETGENSIAFARLLSGNDVYSVENPPIINTSAMGFIDTSLLTVETDEIISVAVQDPDGVYILSSPEGSDRISLEDIPSGKQMKEAVCSSVFKALSSVRFDDVKLEQNISEELKFDTVYKCKLKNKTVYKVVLANDDDKMYAKFSSDYLDHSPVEKENRVESEEELKAKEAKLLAVDSVNNFNQKCNGWVYEIPSYKAGDLTKPLSELIEDIPEPEISDPNEVDTSKSQGAP
jgi:hypothetical protein